MSADAIIISIRNGEGDTITSTVVRIDDTDARQVHILHTDGTTVIPLTSCTWGDDEVRAWINPALTTKG